MTINKLLGYAIESPAKALCRWMLDREIKAFYDARSDLIDRIKAGHREQAIIDREIVALEARRRDM